MKQITTKGITRPEQQEVEVHQTKAEGRRVWVDYAIWDGNNPTNIGQELRLHDLIEFVKEEELNWQYIIAPDVITELDSVTYLFDNMDEVVKLYLEGHLS